MTSRAGGALATAALLLQTCLVAALTVGGLAASASAAPADPTARGAPASSGSPAAAEPQAALPVRIAVDAISPQVLQPGADLSITLTVQNTGQGTLAEPRVSVLLSREAFISRTSLDRWRQSGPGDPAGAVVVHADLAAPLGPGQSAVVVATVPASSVGLRQAATTWGPRGLALRVVDRADPAATAQGHLRTFALWFPEQEVTATLVSILAPVVGPAVDPHAPGWASELERLTGPGGRLANLVGATAEHREVTWVVDPWLLDVTDTEAPAATSDQAETAGAGARAWSRQLTTAMTDREVRLLPYGDADLAALAHAGAGGLLTAAVDRGAEVAMATDVPDTAGTTIAWPAVALPDLVTAAFATERDLDAVVVGPGELPPSAVLTYTPTGRTTVSTASGDVTLLVPDRRLSALLVSGSASADDPEDPDGSPTSDAEAPPAAPVGALDQLTGATAAQDLLAELAVITRERPSDARHLLLTVPRDWSPDAAIVSAQLDALSHAPWVRAAPISALVGAPDSGEDRGTLPTRTVGQDEITPAEIDALVTAVEDRADVAEMVEDPAALVDGLQVELNAPLSVAWRADPPGRAQLVATSIAATEALRGAVSVEPGSTLMLVSATGQVPVQLANSLDQAVTVTVSLRPGNRRLVADKAVTVTIPARGEESVLISVHAIQSADVSVAVEVRTPGGVLVDDSTMVDVRVRAEWESIGSAVIAALLGIGLVIGLFRTIRRGRSRRRAAPVDLGPDALSPEVAATPPDRGADAVVPAGPAASGHGGTP